MEHLLIVPSQSSTHRGGGKVDIRRRRGGRAGALLAAHRWYLSDGDGQLVRLGLAPLERTGVLVVDGHEGVGGTVTDACRPLVP